MFTCCSRQSSFIVQDKQLEKQQVGDGISLNKFSLTFFVIQLDLISNWAKAHTSFSHLSACGLCGDKDKVPFQKLIFYIMHQSKIWHATYAHKNKMIQGVCDISPDNICSGDICPNKNILDQFCCITY